MIVAACLAFAATHYPGHSLGRGLRHRNSPLNADTLAGDAPAGDIAAEIILDISKQAT